MVTQVSREGEGDRDSQGCQGERASGATQAIRVYRASLEQKLKLANQESQVSTKNQETTRSKFEIGFKVIFSCMARQLVCNDY